MKCAIGIFLLGLVLAACDSSSSSDDRDIRGFWDVENPDVRAHLEVTDSTFSQILFAPQPDLDCFIVATSDILTIDERTIILDTSVELRDPFSGEVTVIGEDTVHTYSFDGDTLVLEQGPSGEIVQYVRSTTSLENLGRECTVDNLVGEGQN